MAQDVLILGPFTFTDFGVPDRMPYTGRHQIVKHKYPGGGRDLSMMGPDDDDRSWNGILWGETAQDDAVLLKTLVAQGTELAYVWGLESRLCVIQSFEAEVEKFTCIHYRIEIVFSDGGGGSLGGLQSLTGQIIQDVGAALGSLL